MYGPRVFISMVGTLLVFGLVTYGLTGSLAGTLIRTLLCAVLLQVGYFAGVLLLVWREARERQRKVDEAIVPTAVGAEDKSASSLTVSRLNEPGPSNY